MSVTLLAFEIVDKAMLNQRRMDRRNSDAAPPFQRLALYTVLIRSLVEVEIPHARRIIMAQVSAQIDLSEFFEAATKKSRHDSHPIFLRLFLHKRVCMLEQGS